MSDVKRNQIKLKIAFIADDIDNFTEFDVFHNATFGLMLAAQELNTQVFLAKSNSLKIVNNKVFAKFDEISLKHQLDNYLNVKDTKEYSLDSFNIIFARKDPPINENFISYAQTLLLVSSGPFIVNNPTGILRVNEKLYALNFPHIIPPTIVTFKKSEIINFLNEQSEAVIKPLFNRGGEGVFYLNKNDSKVSLIIDQSTQNETKAALIQKFLPEVKDGDKRIILLNGDPLGAIYRIPKQGEFRANVRRGATVKACELSKRDLEICKTLKPALQKEGIYFASIDVIGDYLIEINVTCPASVQEVERSIKRPIAKEIVNWAIAKCD